MGNTAELSSSPGRSRRRNSRQSATRSRPRSCSRSISCRSRVHVATGRTRPLGAKLTSGRHRAYSHKTTPVPPGSKTPSVAAAAGRLANLPMNEQVASRHYKGQDHEDRVETVGPRRRAASTTSEGAGVGQRPSAATASSDGPSQPAQSACVARAAVALFKVR